MKSGSLGIAVMSYILCLLGMRMEGLLAEQTDTDRVRVATPESPTLPLLSYVEKTLDKAELKPRGIKRLRVPLGEMRWVGSIWWPDENQTLIVSETPDSFVTGWFNFSRVLPDGHLSFITRRKVTDFMFRNYRVLTRDNEPWCVVLDRIHRKAKSAIRIEPNGPMLPIADAPGELLKLPVHVDLCTTMDPKISIEAACQPGPVGIYDGTGRVLANATLPPSLWLVSSDPPPVRTVEGGYELLTCSVGTQELAKWNDKPPGDVTLLFVPSGAKGVCRVLKTFEPPEIPYLAKGIKLIQAFHGLDSPAVAASGKRVAFRENLDLWREQSHEMLQILRLWVWDRTSNKRVLIDTVAAYKSDVGAGHTYAFTFDDQGKLQENYRKYKGWGELAELMPGLSPSGRKIAYRRGDDMIIAEVPEP